MFDEKNNNHNYYNYYSIFPEYAGVVELGFGHEEDENFKD
jgi:hypothetical protein